MAKYSLNLLTILLCLTCFGQQNRKVTLEELIGLVQTQSIKFRVAVNQREMSIEQFRSFRSELKPQISLYGDAPVYQKEFYGVRQPDGTIKYQMISQNTANIGFSLSQVLPFSGGTLSLNTDLSRYDDFKSNLRQYSGTPVFVRYAQPVFAMNPWKWKKKIEPLKLEESKKQYQFELEDLALQTVNYYYNVLDAQNNIEIALANLNFARQNYEIEKKRIKLGTTSEDKILQLELQSLRSEQDLEKARYALQVALLQLASYTGGSVGEGWIFENRDSIPELSLDISKAQEMARENRPEYIGFQRKKLEMEMDIQVAKNYQREVSLVASYGLNGIGNGINNVYQNPNDQQRFSVGFQVPLVDWGRRRSKYAIAKANQKLAQSNQEFQESEITQRITTLVNNLHLLKRNVMVARRTDSVAQRRFQISLQLYQLGKLSLTELSLAQTEKDQARREILSAQRSFWEAYYQLRKETLFDFSTNTNLGKN